MNLPNDNNNQNQISCCQEIVEDNDVIKKIKPILNLGIVIYIIILFVDLFYLDTRNFGSYIFLTLALYLLSFNKCFYIFQFYTIISILLVFDTIIPKIGIIIQIKFRNGTDSIIKFGIYMFILIFSVFIFYFSFVGYKEMRYLFNQRGGTSPLIPSYMPSNTNNYNSNNNSINNNNKSNSGGFKAFSGKGYRVG